MDKEVKSAYEIALEKLKKQDRVKGEEPHAPLTEEQKLRIAEIRRRHEARLAEREILFRSEKAKALASSEAETLEKVENEYARDRERIEGQRDREIAQIRSSSGGPPGRGGRGGKRGRTGGAALLLAGLCLFGGAAPARAGVLAIKAARLLDGGAGPARRDILVVIEGDRIRSVGPAEGGAIPEGAEVIDLRGATLLPGLIDAHTHVFLQGDSTEREYDDQVLGEAIPHRTVRAVAAARAAVENGFTTIRDLGTEGAGYADVALRDAIVEGVVPGPRIFAATRALDITGAYPLLGFALESPVPGGVETADGPDAGRRAVREQIKHGADWIKVYCDRSYFVGASGELDSIPTFEPDELRAIVDEAHRQGRKVAAHAMAPKGIRRALDAGVDSIEHGAALDPESIRRMAAKGVFYCPTLMVMLYVEPGRESEGRGIWARVPEFHKKSFEAALKAGLRIVFGTDAGGFPWTVNEAEEFVWMVRYGMSPAQAIRSATSVAAELLGREKELGRVAAGYRADLVAVSGDPLENIAVMKQVGFVMAAGKVVKNELKPGA